MTRESGAPGAAAASTDWIWDRVMTRVADFRDGPVALKLTEPTVPETEAPSSSR